MADSESRDATRSRSGFRLAKAASALTFPPILAIPAFLALDLWTPHSDSLGWLLAGSLGFGAVLPIALVVLSTKGRAQWTGPDDHRGRLELIASAVIVYAIGVVALLAIGAPVLVTLLMFCYASNTSVMFGINLYWKASIHTMGVAGPTTALVFAFGLPGATLSLLLPVVGWSRVRLKEHSLSQVIVGTLLGYLLTASQFLVGLHLGYAVSP